jgi:hypothetical protein
MSQKEKTMNTQPIKTQRLTPWGKAEQWYVIAPGVAWTEASRGSGFVIASKAAQKYLSEPARKRGRWTKQFYAFSADSLAAIVLFEHPEWSVLEIETNSEELLGFLSCEHQDYLSERSISSIAPIQYWGATIRV